MAALPTVGEGESASSTSPAALGRVPLTRASSGTGGDEAAPRQLPWLNSWLGSLQLANHLESALAWCEVMGAVEVDELRENWDDLADHLDLCASERERVAEFLSIATSGSEQEEEEETLDALDASSPSSLRIFESCDASYCILEEIGRGATATVFRCTKGEEVFAAKVINLKKVRRQPNFAQIFQMLNREITLLWTCRHSKIVQLFDVVDTPDELFLVMEFMDGGDLADRIVSKGRLPEDEARHIFVQLIDALKYIHKKNIVHRDLKPENILIDSRASQPGKLEVKLSDLGHSKLIRDGYSRVQSTVGTPEYWAPEVVKTGVRYDEKADVWSLGVVLYVMIVGQYPFDDNSAAREARFPFRGSRHTEELLRGLIRVSPGARLTLDQCSQSAWVTHGAPALALRPPLASAEPSRELRVRLPRPPEDLPAFRAELSAISRRHRMAATLLLLDVVLEGGPHIEDGTLKLAHRDLMELVARRFPEHTRQARPRTPPLDEAITAARAEEQEALEAIYGSEFEVHGGADWFINLGGAAALRVHLPPGYPRAEPPIVSVDGIELALLTEVLQRMRDQWVLGDVCVHQWAEEFREALGDRSNIESDAPAACAHGSVEAVEAKVTLELGLCAHWEFQDDEDDWVRLGSGDSQIVEAAFAKDSLGVFELTTGPYNTAYVINFSQMREVNKLSGRSRAVRRRIDVVDVGSEQSNLPGGLVYYVKKPGGKMVERNRYFGPESKDPRNNVELVHGRLLEERKSIFQAHAACVTSVAQVQWAHRHLLAESDAADATHNVLAYRLRDGEGALVEASDDDGEFGGGAHLLSRLRESWAEGVVVIISRWRGVERLGLDRYKYMDHVMRGVLNDERLLLHVLPQGTNAEIDLLPTSLCQRNLSNSSGSGPPRKRDEGEQLPINPGKRNGLNGCGAVYGKDGLVLVDFFIRKPNPKDAQKVDAQALIVADTQGSAVGVQLAAPPHKGEANNELLAFAAGVFGLNKASVSLHTGVQSRKKVVRLEGIVLVEARERLSYYLRCAVIGKS